MQTIKLQNEDYIYTIDVPVTATTATRKAQPGKAYNLK